MTTEPTGKAVDEAFAKDLTAGQKKVVLGGADRFGSTSAASVFRSAHEKVRLSRTGTPGAATAIAPASAAVVLDPGVYTVDEVEAMMPGKALVDMTYGLHIDAPHGATVIFNPTAAGVALINFRWVGVWFSNIRFVCGDRAAGSTVYLGDNSAGSASQGVHFIQCAFDGPWKYGIRLQGDNNNSEFSFWDLDVSGFQNDGAVLYVDATVGSDQFLNYYFGGITKLWGTDAALVRMSKGGSITIDHLDASGWGKAGTGTLIELRGSSHADGVTQFLCHHLRLEDFGANTRVLYSEWSNGNVTFSSVDQSSQLGAHVQSGASPYGVKWDIALAADGSDHPGAIYKISNSRLAGKIRVSSNWGTNNQRPRIIVEDSEWADFIRPSDVVQFVPANAEYIWPQVEFRGCRSDSAQAEGSWATWDATIGWQHQRTADTPKLRQVVVTNDWSNAGLKSTVALKLPTPAMITGLRAIGPAGTASAGAYQLWSGGAQVASVSVAAGSAGFTNAATMVPVYLDTAAKTAVEVRTTLTSAPPQTRVIVEGYW